MTSPNEMAAMHALEQELHTFTVQRESLRAQLAEVESASAELANAKSAYRIVGTIMVESSPEKLKSELASKRDELQEKIKGLENKEQELRSKFESAQGQALKGENDE